MQNFFIALRKPNLIFKNVQNRQMNLPLVVHDITK